MGVVLLAGCATHTDTTSSTPLSGYPEGPSGPFAPDDLQGVEGRGSLTLAREAAAHRRRTAMPAG